MQPGVGIYTPVEAGRLVGLEPRRVRRWAGGYAERDGGGAALFRRDLPTVNGRVALSFLDLLEVLFVRAFLESGVSMATIRLAAAYGAREFGTSHPFTLRRFQTDGRAIFARFGDRDGVERMLQLGRGGQLVFVKVMDAVLKQLDHDPETEQASRWWPMGKSRFVVVDPTRAMGAPSVAGFVVPTETIYATKRAGESDEAIADWYGVPVARVRDAIEFEESRGRVRRAA